MSSYRAKDLKGETKKIVQLNNVINQSVPYMILRATSEKSFANVVKDFHNKCTSINKPLLKHNVIFRLFPSHKSHQLILKILFCLEINSLHKQQVERLQSCVRKLCCTFWHAYLYLLSQTYPSLAYFHNLR